MSFWVLPGSTLDGIAKGWQFAKLEGVSVMLHSALQDVWSLGMKISTAQNLHHSEGLTLRVQRTQ